MSKLILTADPGDMTGFAIHIVGEEKPRIADEMLHFDFLSFADRAIARLALQYDMTVVCEAFIITQETAKKAPTTSSLEQLGALRYFARKHGARFVTQAPSAVKSFATDKKLHMIDWYIPGKGHANDALRHLLVHLVDTDEFDVRTLLY